MYPLPSQQEGDYHSGMDVKDIIPRIGTFFIIMSIGFLFLFAISDPSEINYFDFLFIGIFFAGIGIFLRRKAKPPPPANRFSMFKRKRDQDNKNK